MTSIDEHSLYSEAPRMLDGIAVQASGHSGVVQNNDASRIFHLPVDRRLRLVCLAIVLIALIVALASAKDRPDERLKSVTTIFVDPSDRLSEIERQKIRSGKTCFTLAPEVSSADAILEIVRDSGPADTGTNTVGATANLTLKSGERVWSRSERVVCSRNMWSDLVNRLIDRLAADAGCRTRTKAK